MQFHKSFMFHFLGETMGHKAVLKQAFVNENNVKR
jgi:hypothetical protein